MKKVALVLCFTCVFASAPRADIPFWMSIDAGFTRTLLQEDYQDQIDDAGLTASLSGTDDWRSGLRLGIGMDLDSLLPEVTPWHLAVELQSFSLGEIDVDYSGTFADAASFYAALSDIHPESADSGVSLTLLGRWQGFSGQLAPVSLGARVGLFHWSQHYELEDSSGNVVGTDSKSGVSPTAGLEASYDINRQLTFRSGWQMYWLQDEGAQLFSAGLEWRP